MVLETSPQSYVVDLTKCIRITCATALLKMEIVDLSDESFYAINTTPWSTVCQE